MKLRKFDGNVVHLAPDPPPKTEAWEFNGRRYRSVVAVKNLVNGRNMPPPTLALCGAKLRGRVIVVSNTTKVTCLPCRRS